MKEVIDPVTTADPQVGAPVAWLPVEPEQLVRPHRGTQAPAVKVRGHGACSFNAAARYLLGEVALGRGLGVRFPWGLAVARETGAGNPVLMPVKEQDPRAIAINWSGHGRHANFNLSGPLQAWGIPVRLGRKQVLYVPVEIVPEPATGKPGVLLQWSLRTVHEITPRPHQRQRSPRLPVQAPSVVVLAETAGEDET